MINHKFLTTETNLKALYIFRWFFTTSSVKPFVVNIQIFVYHCVFRKKEKQHSLSLSHFEKKKTDFETFGINKAQPTECRFLSKNVLIHRFFFLFNWQRN